MMLGLWLMSFIAIGVQYTFGDVFGVNLTIMCTDSLVMDCNDLYGQPMKGYLIGYVEQAKIKEILQGSLSGTNGGVIDRIVESVQAAAYVGWNIIGLLTGTTAFTFLWFLGVPSIFIIGFIFVYAIFLIRAIVGYIRGV